MPIYEYKCRKCEFKFEKLMFPNDPEPECPECHCEDVEKLMSAGCFRPHGIPAGSGGFAPPPSSCGGG